MFEDFWNNVTFSTPSGSNWQGDNRGREIRSYAGNYSGNPRVKEAIEKYEEEKLRMKADPHKWEVYAKSFYGHSRRFQTPFLSIAEEILSAAKEGLLAKLIIISAYNVDRPGQIAAIGKRNKQETTFGKLPITTIELTPQEKKREGGKTVSTTNLRWDIIKNKYPDFDIFIDDNPKIIEEFIENLNDDSKVYVLPDYKCNRYLQGKNIYRNSVSNLKDEDFIVKNNILCQKNQKNAFFAAY